MQPNGNPSELCWCGSLKPYRACHQPIDQRVAEFARQGHEVPARSMLKTPRQIEGLRASARVNVQVLDAVAQVIAPGMTTEQIDQLVYKTTRRLGGQPAPLHYEGFPKSVCTSINHQVCHGIPSPRDVLRLGDIVNVDVSTRLDGYYSDSSRMFLIGEVDERKRRLVEVAHACVEKGLEQVKPWHFLGDMGQAVHRHARKNGYSVVRQIGGHGIGLAFHEDPWVSYVSRAGTEMLMVPGMVFTIEPMINMGSDEIYQDAGNGWTIYTEDGLPSAQWEIMVLVTEEGHEVLAY